MSLHHRTSRVLVVLATASLTLGIGAGAAHAVTVPARGELPQLPQPDLPFLPPIDVDPCVLLLQLCDPPTTDPDPTTTTTVPTTDTTVPTTDTTVPHDDMTPTGDPDPVAPAPHTVVTGSPHFTG